METLETTDTRTEPCMTHPVTNTGDNVGSITSDDDTGACRSCANKQNWRNRPSLVNGDELIKLFNSLHSGKKVHEGVTTIGLVGSCQCFFIVPNILLTMRGHLYEDKL